MKKSTRYLVTGGAGFIGSFLTENLLTNPANTVCVLDNFSSGSIANLKTVKSNPRLSIIEGSILNKKKLIQALKNIEFVFHLAASLGVKNVIENPLECLENNLIGTKNVFNQTLKQKVPVLYASSSEVYGKSKDLPFCEDGDCVYGPPTISRWGYAVTKLLDELTAICLWREKRLPTIGVRLFNIVGPRQSLDAGFVLPNFIQKALKGEDLVIYGTGQQERTLTHVNDAIDAIIKLSQTPKSFGEIFNVGSTNLITVEGLAKKVVKLAGSSSKIKKVPYKTIFGEHFEDMKTRIPSLKKLHSITGFKPRYNLDQIILDTIDWIKNNQLD